MKVIKLIYFADRYHVRNYGRPITNDEYVAMDYGPVGSKTKDIAENTDFLDTVERDYRKNYIKRRGKYYIESISAVDISVFSDSDIEALEFAIKNFGGFDPYQLANISHAYPEWKKFEKALKSGQGDVFDMDYEDFFKDALQGDENLTLLNGRDLFSSHADDKEAMLDYMKEQQKLKTLWERQSD